MRRSTTHCRAHNASHNTITRTAQHNQHPPTNIHPAHSSSSSTTKGLPPYMPLHGVRRLGRREPREQLRLARVGALRARALEARLHPVGDAVGADAAALLDDCGGRRTGAQGRCGSGRCSVGGVWGVSWVPRLRTSRIRRPSAPCSNPLPLFLPTQHITPCSQNTHTKHTHAHTHAQNAAHRRSRATRAARARGARRRASPRPRRASRSAPAGRAPRPRRRRRRRRASRTTRAGRRRRRRRAGRRAVCAQEERGEERGGGSVMRRLRVNT